MSLFALLDKWSWLVFIGVIVLNAGIFRAMAQKHVQEDPSLAEGYRTLIRGFLFWGTLPGIVAGAGMIFGGVDSAFDYFRPQDGNPYVLAYFGTITLIWILGTYWLFFRGGAEMLVRHSALLGDKVTRPRTVKVFWVICLVGGIAGVISMYFNGDQPSPHGPFRVLSEPHMLQNLLIGLGVVTWVGGGNVLIAFHYRRMGKPWWTGFKPFALAFKDFNAREWLMLLILFVMTMAFMITGMYVR